MGNAGAVQAGKAFVELFVKNGMAPGLASARKQVMAWGKSLAVVGGAFVGLGSAITGPIIAAAHSFAEGGTELLHLSTQTGLAVSDLKSLKFVAEETGTSIESMTTGFRGMSKFTLQLAQGSKQAAGTLGMLGISAADFLGASPVEKLKLLADGLNSVQDPSIRSALAMKVLGRSGGELYRTLSLGSKGIDEMMARARHFGGTATEEGVHKAHELHNAYTDLSTAIKSAWNGMGAAIAEPLTEWIHWLAEGMASVREFVANNQALVRIAFVVGAVITGIGFAFLGLRAAAYGVAAAMTVYNAVLTAYSVVCGIAAAITAVLESELLIPVVIVGLIAAGLIAGIAAWLAWTESGQWAASSIGGAFGDAFSVVKETLGGIFDAIMAGDWNLAAAVAMAGLNAVFQRGMLMLQELWMGFKTWFLNLLSDIWAAIPESLAGMQGMIVNAINQIRESVGLAGNVEGFSAINDAAAQSRDAADKMKSDRNAALEKDMAALGGPYRDALATLGTSITAASAAHAALNAKQDAAAKADRDRLRASQKYGLPGSLTSPAGSNLGAFSASVVRFMGVNAADDAKRSADATEEIRDKMDDLIGAVDDGGLEFAGG